ncbi:hypothetical protein H0E84_09025 [Luteimonas sp. SJ-92]|uniref:Uncharacterized protein n=1 Tax=Luteimonas salinisoli TaxID=2752307 RepID=A0A853JD28_9GAMM|nr:hypothetical protein [Luteimonas salinisoli]NZA26527.1 hypothetical protein [Luteimonas salinisoli]
MSEFSGRLGPYEFRLGAGSVSGLVMIISVLWIAVAFMARPKIEFSMADDGAPIWMRVIANVEVAQDAQFPQDHRFRSEYSSILDSKEDRTAALEAAAAAANDSAIAAESAASNAAEVADALDEVLDASAELDASIESEPAGESD